MAVAPTCTPPAGTTARGPAQLVPIQRVSATCRIVGCNVTSRHEVPVGCCVALPTVRKTLEIGDPPPPPASPPPPDPPSLPPPVSLQASLMDRFLHCMDVAPKRYQAVALACILLASKYEEMEESVPSVEAVYRSTRGDSAVSQLANGVHYGEEFVHQMELLILHAFGWNMTCVTPVHFIMHFNNEGLVHRGDSIHNTAPSARVARYVSKYTTFFADICMQDFELSTALPSLLAAAIVLTSRRALSVRPVWSPELAQLTGYEEEDLVHVCNSLWSVYTAAFPNEALRQEALSIKHDQAAARSGLISITALRDLYGRYPVLQAELPAELRPRPAMPTPSAPGSPADSPPERGSSGRDRVSAPATPSGAAAGPPRASAIIPGFGGTLAASAGAAPGHAHSAAVAGLAAAAAAGAAPVSASLPWGRPLPTSPEAAAGLSGSPSGFPSADNSFTSTSSGGALSESVLRDTSRGSSSGVPAPATTGVLMSPVAGLAAFMGPLGIHDIEATPVALIGASPITVASSGATPVTALSSGSGALTVVGSERSSGSGATYLSGSGLGWGAASGVAVYAPDSSVVRALWAGDASAAADPLVLPPAQPVAAAMTPVQPPSGAGYVYYPPTAVAAAPFASAAAPATKQQHAPTSLEYQAAPSKGATRSGGLAPLPAAVANEKAAGADKAAASGQQRCSSSSLV